MNSSRIKVIYLIGELGRGGSERQLYLLLKNMDLSVLEPFVVVFNPSDYAVYNDELRLLGIQVYEIPHQGIGIFVRILFLYRIFAWIKPKIVHSWTVHDNPYAGLVGWLACIPVRLGSLRSSFFHQGFQSLPGWMKYLCLFTVQYLVVNSHATALELQKKNYPQEKIFQLQNCVEIVDRRLALTDELKKRLELPDKYCLIGAIGNLRRNKNLDIFTRGMAALAERYPYVYGIMVGQSIADEFNYQEEIQNLIVQSGLENRVLIFGFCDLVPELMHELYICCLLSDNEGTPNAILEAMAAARPVIATKVGGIPDLIHQGSNGILIEPRDEAGFIAALQKLIDSPSLAEQMGIVSLQMVKSSYSCKTMSERIIQFYNHLLERQS